MLNWFPKIRISNLLKWVLSTASAYTPPQLGHLIAYSKRHLGNRWGMPCSPFRNNQGSKLTGFGTSLASAYLAALASTQQRSLPLRAMFMFVSGPLGILRIMPILLVIFQDSKEFKVKSQKARHFLDDSK